MCVLYSVQLCLTLRCSGRSSLAAGGAARPANGPKELPHTRGMWQQPVALAQLEHKGQRLQHAWQVGAGAAPGSHASVGITRRQCRSPKASAGRQAAEQITITNR